MLLYKLRKVLAAFFIEASSTTVMLAVFIYAALSYSLLHLCGEKEIVAADVFFYWLVVTASTVGYGDFSPITPAGRNVTAIFVIPVGLSLFALLIGRFGFYLSEKVQKGKKGLRMTKVKDHCVIIGWNGGRTLRLINLLLAKENGHTEKIVLCHNESMLNPLPSKIEFVKVDSFTDRESMERTNLANAARIIIDTPMDDVTLTTALFCKQVSPNSHKTVYFKDESHGELLAPYCPNAEVVPSVSIEMLARASIDPGSAKLHQQLLDPSCGSSQYSSEFTREEEILFGDLYFEFRKNFQATLIGVRSSGNKDIELNPDDNKRVKRGDTLYYIASKRLVMKSSTKGVNLELA